MDMQYDLNGYRNENENGNGKPECPKKGTVVLVLGILALITVLSFINYAFALAGIIVGIVFLVKNKEYALRKRVVAGLVLSGLSIVLSTTLWVSVYLYFTRTDVATLLKDMSAVVMVLTDGEVNIEEEVRSEVNDMINSYKEEIPELASVEKAIGATLDYDYLTEFVGKELSVKKINDFVGEGIDPGRLEKVMREVDYRAVYEDLGEEFTYKKLQEKVGKDFSYEELITYLEKFEKKTP